MGTSPGISGDLKPRAGEVGDGTSVGTGMSVEEDCNVASGIRCRLEGRIDLGTLTAASPPSSRDTGVVEDGTAVGTGISVGEDEAAQGESCCCNTSTAG